jgi:cobyric acid synthase
VIIDEEGGIILKKGLEWGEIPSFISYKRPYVISGLKDRVEIRRLKEEKNSLAQTIKIDSILYSSQENYIDLDTLELHSERKKLKKSNSFDNVNISEEMNVSNNLFIAGKKKVKNK